MLWETQIHQVEENWGPHEDLQLCCPPANISFPATSVKPAHLEEDTPAAFDINPWDTLPSALWSRDELTLLNPVQAAC